jgi:serine/threonine protein kinase
MMTALRHPNVVLFMAACTKAPKMCIVMEFMSLGSLMEVRRNLAMLLHRTYTQSAPCPQLLHNELIPEIPFALKAKMAYQASKGMHFLHSSGIVHRDLKSLNLLLDAKWNVKVSDFGLTKFREDINTKGGAVHDIAGSVHWTAPEVLNESGDVDLILADVYSFGIILWELLTREQPYLGLSPAAVAVSVIRDNLRPAIPENTASLWPIEYEELITSCWHQDPTIRPTFLEVMTRLSSMHGDSTSLGATSKTSSSSDGTTRRVHVPGESWTLPSTGSASNGSSSSASSVRSLQARATAGAGAVRAPEGELAIVFTDITRAASLWEFNASAMRDATLLHNDALRGALQKHRGYEVAFLRDRNSGEGSFCLAFQHAADALAWCAEIQQALIKVEWPEALLEHPGAAEEWGDMDDRVLFKGLRVRMGVHVGTPKVVRDAMTRRVEYIGPVVNAAARITALTHGGQIVLSEAAFAKVKDSAELRQQRRLVGLGKFEMPDAPHGTILAQLYTAPQAAHASRPPVYSERM